MDCSEEVSEAEVSHRQMVTSQPSFHNTNSPPIIIDVKISNIGQEDVENEPSQELIEQITVETQRKEEDDQYIELGKLLMQLRVCYNMQFQGHQICVYMPSSTVFVNCGVYPLPELVHLAVQDFVDYSKNGLLMLQVQKVNSYCMLEHEMAKQMSGFMVERPPKLIGKGKGRGRRDVFGKKNFQKIGYIVKTVIASKLRKLNKAAHRKDMSKKSIEDYLYQIKIGHKYFFDFNEHHRQDMKVLRKFVRDRLAEQKFRFEDRENLDQYFSLRE